MLTINIEMQLEWNDIYKLGVDETLRRAVAAILQNNTLPETVKKIMAEREARGECPPNNKM